MQKVRARLVNFRVTDDELAQLKTASDRHGARCLSAFARKMILNAANDIEPRADRLEALDHRLSILEDSISRLFRAVNSAQVSGNFTDK